MTPGSAPLCHSENGLGFYSRFRCFGSPGPPHFLPQSKNMHSGFFFSKGERTSCLMGRETVKAYFRLAPHKDERLREEQTKPKDVRPEPDLSSGELSSFNRLQSQGATS